MVEKIVAANNPRLWLLPGYNVDIVYEGIGLFCVIAMAQSLRRAVAGGGSVLELPDEEEFSEERIAHIMRKIGFVAACIDLDRWRHVIDQVLREVEAGNRLQPDRTAPRH